MTLMADRATLTSQIGKTRTGATSTRSCFSCGRNGTRRVSCTPRQPLAPRTGMSSITARSCARRFHEGGEGRLGGSCVAGLAGLAGLVAAGTTITKVDSRNGRRLGRESARTLTRDMTTRGCLHGGGHQRLSQWALAPYHKLTTLWLSMRQPTLDLALTPPDSASHQQSRYCRPRPLSAVYLCSSYLHSHHCVPRQTVSTTASTRTPGPLARTYGPIRMLSLRVLCRSIGCLRS